MASTPFDEREQAFEGAWAREEQRKALDALKKTMAVKRTPINEDFEKERLNKILDKAGFAEGADRDGLTVRLLLWKHDEVCFCQPAPCAFACWSHLLNCARCSPAVSTFIVTPAGSHPCVQVGVARDSCIVHRPVACRLLGSVTAEGEGSEGKGRKGSWGGSLRAPSCPRPELCGS
jgi:hypothetical protein